MNLFDNLYYVKNENLSLNSFIYNISKPCASYF